MVKVRQILQDFPIVVPRPVFGRRLSHFILVRDVIPLVLQVDALQVLGRSRVIGMDTGQLEHVLRWDKGPVFRLVPSIHLVVRISNRHRWAHVLLVGVFRLFDEPKPRVVGVVVNEILLDGGKTSVDESVLSTLVSAVL